jgi:hypothetical protein
VKRIAWGYTLQKGKQIRVTRADWTEDDAQTALAAAPLGRDRPNPADAPPTLTVTARAGADGSGDAADVRTWFCPMGALWRFARETGES